MLGGGGQDDQDLCDWFGFKVRNGMWTQRTMEGDIPIPRHRHCFAVVDGSFFVFGGEGHQGLLNDLYQLSIVRTEVERFKRLLKKNSKYCDVVVVCESTKRKRHEDDRNVLKVRKLE